jgi:hypothetical protein
MSYLLNYKKWSALYEQAKADAALFEDGGDDIIAADGKTANVDSNKIKPKEDEKLPSDIVKRIEYLVDKSVDDDSATVKNTAKNSSNWVRPWDAIMDWMWAKGDPGKENNNVKKLIQYTPSLEKRFESTKPSMKKEDIARCMEYWCGIMDTSNTSNNYGVAESNQLIKHLEQLSDPKKVKSLIENGWNAKSKTGYPLTKFNTNMDPEYEFEGTKYSAGKNVSIDFDQALIVEKSKILLQKAKEAFEKSGKSRRDALTDMFSPGMRSDNVWFSIDDTKKGREQTGRFWLWYKIISDDTQFKKLLDRFDNPTYVRTLFTKMTDQDKIDIINGIMEMSRARWGKSTSLNPEAAIYLASSITWWPADAQETMPETIVVTPAGEGTEVEYENEWDFSWPYSKDGGQELAMTYFKSDKAIIQDGKAAEIDNAVKQILAEIKSKNGTLKSLTYKVVASTSDEPSAYATLNQTTTNIGIQNNFPLVKDRAKVIENALIAAINTNGIDKILVIRDGESLVANNTLGGQAVFNEKKWMRTDRNYGKGPNGETPNAQTNAEYQALFSKAKHSGILFNVVYTTIEKEKGEPTPEETTVSDYKVVGEWLYQITWSGSGGYKKKKRRTRPRRPIRGINWDKVFPPLIDVLGVDDLCDAYGRSGPG